MTELNPIHFYTTCAWMRTELDLKGYELMAYALVYHYSQQKNGMYHAGINYLSSWMGCSDKTTWRTLKSLVEKDLIIENQGADSRGVKFCNYRTNADKLPAISIQKANGQNDEGYGQNDGRGIVKMTSIDKNIDKEYIKREILKREIPTTPRFVKPTIEEVQTYCNERKNGISGEEFWNFYESKGWMVGRNPMKDWRAGVRTWELSRAKSGKVRKTATTIDKQFNPYD